MRIATATPDRSANPPSRRSRWMPTERARHDGDERVYHGLCGSCMIVPDAQRSDLGTATDWTLWADTTITFRGAAMTTQHHFGLVLDCADPERLATFWADALGYTRTGAAGSYVALHPADGHGPKLLLQRVDERKTVKNRMHLDIDARDIETEARRLEALGANRVRPSTISEFGTTWILMTDPEGNEFCVCDGGHPD